MSSLLVNVMSLSAYCSRYDCPRDSDKVCTQGGEAGMQRTDSEKPTAEHHHAVAQLPSVILNSDMEAFGNRLNAIVNADFYAAALAAGPVDVPLGPLQALSAHLPADNSAQAANTEEILKQLRQMQEQVPFASSHLCAVTACEPARKAVPLQHAECCHAVDSLMRWTHCLAIFMLALMSSSHQHLTS